MANVVLGRFPNYLRLSDRLAAQDFCVSKSTWTAMTPMQRWRENRFFLDRAIAREDQFVLSDRPRRARPGSSFDRELRYLNAREAPVRKRIVAHLL